MCVDGDMLVSVSLDGDIRVWDSQPRGRRCLRTIVRRCAHTHVHVPLWHPYLNQAGVQYGFTAAVHIFALIG